MSARPRHVLFLCTGNSARSILAEAILNDLGAGRFRAWSAGSHPRGEVHPQALATLRRHGHATQGLASKSWDVFAAPGAPPIDMIVTVCDAAAQEVCPVWPGRPATAHWGLSDPAAEGDEAAFERAYEILRARIAAFVALPLQGLSQDALRTEMAAIAKLGARTPS